MELKGSSFHHIPTIDPGCTQRLCPSAKGRLHEEDNRGTLFKEVQYSKQQLMLEVGISSDRNVKDHKVSVQGFSKMSGAPRITVEHVMQKEAVHDVTLSDGIQGG